MKNRIVRYLGILFLLGFLPAHWFFGSLTITQKLALTFFEKASQLECSYGNLTAWGYLARGNGIKPHGIVCITELLSFTAPNFEDNPSKARDTEEFSLRYDSFARLYLQPAGLNVEFKNRVPDGPMPRSCFLSEPKTGWYTCQDSLSGCYMKSCQRYPITAEGN